MLENRDRALWRGRDVADFGRGLFEDDDLIRMTSMEMLSDIGCKVKEASTAQEALTILDRLFDQGEEPLKVLGAFSMQLRRLAQAYRQVVADRRAVPDHRFGGSPLWAPSSAGDARATAEPADDERELRLAGQPESGKVLEHDSVIVASPKPHDADMCRGFSLTESQVKSFFTRPRCWTPTR